MKRALISALTLFAVIAPVGVASAAETGRIEGYQIRAAVEAERMAFENCMERLNSGKTTLQHCAPQWAAPVVEVPETTTTTFVAPTTTVPAPTPTTVPVVNEPTPTTTVAPAPTTTTTTIPADPVEACIQDYRNCLTEAIHAYIDVEWALPDHDPTDYFPVNFYAGDTGWGGPCMGTKCTYLSTLRQWGAPEIL